MKPAARIVFAGSVTALSILLARCVAVAGPRTAWNAKGPDRVLRGHTDGVLSLAFFPDSVRIASGSHDRTIRIWDTNSGECVRVIEGHLGPVYSVAVSPDGKWVVSGSTDRTIRVWDAANGEQIAQLEGHTGTIRAMAFLPDGRLLSGGGDGLRLWDVANEKLLWASKDRARIFALAVSKDGKRAATTAWDCVTRLYDLVARTPAREIAERGPSIPQAVGISPDGKTVYALSGGSDGGLGAYDVDHDRRQALPSQLATAHKFALSPDGKSAFIDMAPHLTVWDTATWKPILAFEPLVYNGPGVNMLHAMAVSPDGKRMVCGGGGTEDGVRWFPGSQNIISVFLLPKLQEPAPVTNAGGAVSWEVIPATVKKRSGQTVPFEKYTGSLDDMPTTDVVAKMTDHLDVISTTRWVLFHRQKGLLEEVLTDPEGGFDSAAWDGKHVWIAGARGLYVLEPDGRLAARIDAGNGIPPGEYRTRVHALTSGKVLLAAAPNLKYDQAGKLLPGQDGIAAWLALVSWGGNGHHAPEVKLLLSASNPPVGWPAFGREFNPIWTTETPHAAGAPREILIACSRVEPTPQPILRVNADTLAVTLYNMKPAHWPRNRAPGFLGFTAPPYWLGARAAIPRADPLERVELGEQYVDPAKTQGLGERLQSWPYVEILPLNGKLYVPWKRWREVDPVTLKVKDLGPGLFVDGKPVEHFIRYFDSGVLGMAAISSIDGCFYHFTVNPSYVPPAPEKAPGRTR